MLKIEKIIESKSIKNEQRSYLGISQIGLKCQRWLWYDFRFATKPEMVTPRGQRLFNRGHWEELLIINDLINAGCKVEGITIDRSILKIFKNVFNIDLPIIKQEKTTFCHGHGSGHCDGSLYKLIGFQNSKKPILLECKTSNNKGFTALKNSRDLKKSKPEHYSQIQGYMDQFGMEDCLYIMTRKETDERIYLHLKLDEKFAKNNIDIASKIVLSGSPPDKIGDSNFYMCRKFICKIEQVEKYFCPHREVCHNDAKYNKTCRTCKSVEIHDKGRWKCTRKKKYLSFKKQLKACKNITF